MKKISILLLLTMTICTAFGRDKLAVYVAGNNNAAENKLIATKLVAAIAKDGFYEVVERTDAFLAQIKKEQSYQQSGNVDDDQLTRLGKQFGVQKVCIVEVLPVARAYFLSARIVNVETARVEATADATCESTNNINAIVASANELGEKLLNEDAPSKNIAQKTTTTTVPKQPMSVSSTPAPTPNVKAIKPSIQNQAELLNIENGFWGQKVTNSMGIKLSTKEIQDIMATVPEALQKYNSGRNLRTTGIILTVVGAGLEIIGAIIIGTNSDQIDNNYLYTTVRYDESKENKIIGGAILAAAGGVSMLTGIILSAVGYSKVPQSIRIYNNAIYNRNKSDVSLKFGMTQSGGIGLTLYF
jgi:hypothetical protein